MPQRRKEEGIGDAAILKWTENNLREHFWQNKSHIIVDANGYEWGPCKTLKDCVLSAIVFRNHLRSRGITRRQYENHG